MSFSVVIPSRSAANLAPCIRAIREAGETARIIVVDDGVDWGVVGDVSAWPVEVIAGIKPFVFARNVNLGIRKAAEDDVVVLNDDAMLKTKSGFSLLASVTRWSGYGLLAAACDTVGNPNQFRRQDGRQLRDEPRMVCFVCVYIPRSTIQTVGPLDERFIHYGMDDDDYSLRVRLAGMKLGVLDDCYVDHGSLQSSYRGGPQAGGDFRPNMRLFIEKWGTDNWGHGRETSEFKELFPE